MDGLETDPGEAYTKIPWAEPESGRRAVLLEWTARYRAPQRKPLSAGVFVLPGRLRVRDETLEAADHVYEPNGMEHGATTVLADTTYPFLCAGPALFCDDNRFHGYPGWMRLARSHARAPKTSGRWPATPGSGGSSNLPRRSPIS